jgi:hypothetical protein
MKLTHEPELRSERMLRFQFRDEPAKTDRAISDVQNRALSIAHAALSMAHVTALGRDQDASHVIALWAFVSDQSRLFGTRGYGDNVIHPCSAARA